MGGNFLGGNFAGVNFLRTLIYKLFFQKHCPKVLYEKRIKKYCAKLTGIACVGIAF